MHPTLEISFMDQKQTKLNITTVLKMHKTYISSTMRTIKKDTLNLNVFVV